ncbi:MAG TPA: hypothetical protein VK474_05575, partial [Chthoniobacterales bacterium]|nr:hypothetical protein [Chthoniobacterales bacterium]
MQVLAGRPAAFKKPAPLQEFSLAAGRAAIFARAADIAPQLWLATFGKQTKDFSYYELLERTMAPGFCYRYLVLTNDDGRPVALQPLILVDQDLSLSLGR